jgi:uncharacterized protein DUF3127
MELQITGEVIDILDEQSGTGRNGPWRKQEFILETQGEYAKQVCIVQWGDNIDKFAVQQGETVTAYVDIQSREYNGRWYTDVKAWKVERGKATGSDPSAAGEASADDEPRTDPPPASDSDEDDGLPF